MPEPSESGWIYWHDLGRINLENELGDRVITEVSVCPDPERYEALNGTVALDAVALAKGSRLLRAHDPKPAIETIKLLFDK